MKRTFTLIETLIAMMLVTLLLTTIAYFYRDLGNMQADIAKTREKALRICCLQARLADVLPRIESFTEGLRFSYDNGARSRPEFSGIVNGEIFVDGQQQLLLKIWSEKGGSPAHQEILFKEVKSFSFSFYKPGGWSLETDPLPVLIRLTINEEDFTYPLSNNKQAIAL